MVTIRPFREGDDSPEEVAALLRRAYAPLAERNLRFVATTMTAETVRDRLTKSACLLAFEYDRLAGTVMVCPSDPESECELYRQPGVYYFGKFGVEPALKGRGIGRALFEAAERHARACGAHTFACDTAAPAVELIDLYQGWGFEIVAKQNWSVTNYESVVLAKRLN